MKGEAGRERQEAEEVGSREVSKRERHRDRDREEARERERVLHRSH